MSDTTYLYRLYDDAGQLLYIGISKSAIHRLHQHLESQPWASQIVSTRIERHPTREIAAAAERDAIITEKPLHNVMHNRDASPRDRNHGASKAPADDGLACTMVTEGGHFIASPLRLTYDIAYDCISDEYLFDDISTAELFDEWVGYARKRKGDIVPITWYVDGHCIFEDAEEFGRYYRAVTDARTGAPVRTADLPVHLKRWTRQHTDKGGFITQLTGWTPPRLLTCVSIDYLIGQTQ